jgi:poly(3-hydroxybutyrate) depolymerase
MMSGGCGKTPTLKNSPSATTFTYNTITSGGTSRQYILRWPDNYDKSHPYRLIIGLHGATGSGRDVARTPAYFGLFDLSQGSTIFIAPDATGGLWSAAADTTFVSDILKQVEADLCVDLTRVELEGFSQGAAMSWTLACSLPGTFRAAVGHSGGGVANPTTCQPIAYMGSLGLQEGNGQNTQTDQFARFNGCTITTLPRAPTGGHVCTDYMGCPAGKPVRWCSYDGGHTPSPTDAGKSASWMPSEVWPFLSQF